MSCEGAARRRPRQPRRNNIPRGSVPQQLRALGRSIQLLGSDSPALCEGPRRGRQAPPGWAPLQGALIRPDMETAMQTAASPGVLPEEGGVETACAAGATRPRNAETRDGEQHHPADGGYEHGITMMDHRSQQGRKDHYSRDVTKEEDPDDTAAGPNVDQGVPRTSCDPEWPARWGPDRPTPVPVLESMPPGEGPRHPSDRSSD